MQNDFLLKRWVGRVASFFMVFSLTIFPSDRAMADHVPENLGQTLDPNYVGCMMSVDDATPEFRDALQATCIRQLGNVCSGRAGVSPPSQVTECLWFETQRAATFLRAAVADLPVSIDQKGFFGRGYDRRRRELIESVNALAASEKPVTSKEATELAVKMTISMHTLFWLAEETGTSLVQHAAFAARAH